MKRLLVLLGLSAALVLTGCGKSEEDKQREHEIKLAKIQSGQDLAEKEMSHERQLAYYSQPRPIAPIAAGNYIDYRGNLQYGYWDNFGNWRWNNESSAQAMQTRSYLDYQVATGVLAASALAVALSRDDWGRDHRGGWKKQVIVVDKYTSRTGKVISKSEYEANARAAKAERKAWKAKKKQYQAERKLADAKTGYTTDKKGNKITNAEADRRKAQSAKDKSANAKKLKEQKELQRRKEQSARDKAAHAKKVAAKNSQKNKEANAQNNKGLTLKRDNATRTSYGAAPKDKSYSGQSNTSKNSSYNSQNKHKANKNQNKGYGSSSSSRSSSYGSSSSSSKSNYGSSSSSSRNKSSSSSSSKSTNRKKY